MAQRQQHCGDSRGNGWLLSLVDTFERTELLGKVPCDETSISAIRARLARPATVSVRKEEFDPHIRPVGVPANEAKFMRS
ncbi:hypothetical protein BH11PSE4_BH11PSE4_19640 [soil metagenome]